ncbi:MAG TPA: hypothetical protein VKB51_17835 [bacterium]|nr:hypothetical protein [bacterium]
MRTQRATVTHDEIERALGQFHRQGGMITRLPDEAAPPAARLRERWAALDRPLDDLAGLEPAWLTSPFRSTS